MAHEQPGQLEVAGRAPELVAGGVAQLVHREVGGAGLLQAALEPAVHGGWLHGPVAVLADDAAEVGIASRVADAGPGRRCGGS